MTADLLAQALAGNHAAAARLISEIERDGGLEPALSDTIFRRSGRAEVIGVTGTPGAGKSTLVGALVGLLRQAGRRVGVLAIDPSSPRTGGAVLGDRVRMTAFAQDDGVFIRSMANRGHLGGLALAAPAAIRLLDAMGMDVVILETVGVGQSEVAVATAADCVVLVLAPGGGDAVQAMKAGVLEIADVVAINKADLPGAASTRADVGAAVRRSGADRTATVLLTEAQAGTGVPELLAVIHRLLATRRASGALERDRIRRLREETLERAGWQARHHVLAQPERWLDDELLAELADRARDPASIADAVVARALPQRELNA